MARKIGNIRKWYNATYPTDDLYTEIPEDWTFIKLWHAFNTRKKTKKQVSMILDWPDTIIRERTFSELSERKNVDYDFLYYAWLHTSEQED